MFLNIRNLFHLVFFFCSLQQIQLLTFQCFKMVFFETSVVHYHKYHSYAETSHMWHIITVRMGCTEMMSPRNLRFLAEIYKGQYFQSQLQFPVVTVMDLGFCTRIFFPAGPLMIVSSKSAIKALGCMQVLLIMNIAWWTKIFCTIDM